METFLDVAVNLADVPVPRYAVLPADHMPGALGAGYQQTMIPARSAAAGLVQVRVIWLPLRTARRPLTGPGAVRSVLSWKRIVAVTENGTLDLQLAVSTAFILAS